MLPLAAFLCQLTCTFIGKLIFQTTCKLHMLGSVGAVALNTPKPGNVVAARGVVAVCFKEACEQVWQWIFKAQFRIDAAVLC